MRDALRQRIMDALDSSEARCPQFGFVWGSRRACDGLDGCEDCLRLAADAVLRAARCDGPPTEAEIARVLNYAAEQMGWGPHVKPFPTVADLKTFMDERTKLWAEEALHKHELEAGPGHGEERQSDRPQALPHRPTPPVHLPTLGGRDQPNDGE